MAKPLIPNDKVIIKYNTGEYYSDYPSQIILTASRGSTGRIATMEEFVSDFARRVGKRGNEQKQAYFAHFSTVEQAMDRGLQYPVLFENVARPESPTDVLLARPQSIQLLDGEAVEKTGEDSTVNPFSLLFGQSTPKGPSKKIAWPSQGVHDQAKFTDMELAMIMSNPKPATREDIDFVYLRYLSVLPYHNIWFRLKEVIAEAAFDIMDTLHFPKHNHPGYGWSQIAEMIKRNDLQKRLWYTSDQQRALVAAGQKIIQLEKQGKFKAN